MEKITKKGLVLQHLQKYGYISSLTAIVDYGCTRLSAVIYDLKKEGYNIKSETMTCISKVTGNHCNFAKYTLL